MESSATDTAKTSDYKAMNPEKLHQYLSAHAEELGLSADAGDFAVAPIIGGYSNLTYGVDFGGRSWVLRRPPYGANIKSGHDMEREFNILSGLAPIYDKVPRPLVYCDDPEVIGAPFYLMERVDGLILRGLLGEAEQFAPAMMASLADNLIDNLATIHGLDYASTPLGKMARPGSYVERQIKGWLDRYDKSKTEDIPNLDHAGRWLAEHASADVGACLIHNDYKYDNVILDPADPTQIAAVLDWEMATIGDPLMDLGTTLAYWIEPNDPDEIRKLRPPTTLWPGNPDRAALVQRYLVKSGINDSGDPVFYYVYGLYKLAVIAQQIYARYKQGYSNDARFEVLILHIRAIANQATLAIAKNRINDLG